MSRVLALGLAIAALLPAASAGAAEPATVSELVVTASKMVSELTVTATAECLAPALAADPVTARQLRARGTLDCDGDAKTAK